MFDSGISSKQFLNALRRLSVATEHAKPATLHNSVKRILSRADGFEGSKFEDLIAYISDPPKPARSKKASASKKSKLRPHSSTLLQEILSSLSKAESNEKAFAKLVQKYATECSAKTMKEAAASYAAASLPKTKPDAIKLLKSERANRLRTKKKMRESGAANPW